MTQFLHFDFFSKKTVLIQYIESNILSYIVQWYSVTNEYCQLCIFFIIQSLILYHFRLEGVCSDWNVMFNISWTDPYMYVYVRACVSKSRVIDCLSWPEVDRSVINISKDSETSKLDCNYVCFGFQLKL